MRACLGGAQYRAMRHSLLLTLALLSSACQPSRLTAPASPPAAAGAPQVHAAPPGPGTPQVVVVGGGLAGLVTAYELEKRGVAVTILEASDTWGGRVATAYYGQGLFAEYGMQEMWADNPLLKIARELKVELDENVGDPTGSVVIDGKLYPYVQKTEEEHRATFMSPEERRALKGWMEKASAVRGRVEKTPDSNEAEALLAVSFADWVHGFKLPKKVENWIRLTIECELAIDWEHFSGAIGLEEFGFFLGKGMPNYHAKGGNVKVVEALIGAIKGPKLLSSAVMEIDRFGSPSTPRVRVRFVRGGHAESVEADRVVVAVPFVRLHQIYFDPPLPPEKWQGVMTLLRGQYTVVHLLIDKAARDKWLVDGKSPFPILADGPLGVIYGVMHESPPGESLEVFSLLVHGTQASAFHMVPRDLKIAEIKTELDKLWPGLSAHIRGSYVYTYHPASIAVWPPGRSPNDATGRKLREPDRGVYLAGDWTVSGHSNGAVESALSATVAVAVSLKQ